MIQLCCMLHSKHNLRNSASMYFTSKTIITAHGKHSASKHGEDSADGRMFPIWSR